MSGVAMVFIGGGLKLTVSVSPPAASSGGLNGFIPPVTAIAAGGAGGGYTYAWTVVSSSGPLTINTPSVATTSFNFTDPTVGADAIVRITVTSGGATEFCDVPVQYFSYY